MIEYGVSALKTHLSTVTHPGLPCGRQKSQLHFIVAKTYLAIAFKAAFDVDASAPRAAWVLGALQTLILIFAPMMKDGFPFRPSTFFTM